MRRAESACARVLAVLSERSLVREIWMPDPSIRAERELARFAHLGRRRNRQDSYWAEGHLGHVTRTE